MAVVMATTPLTTTAATPTTTTITTITRAITRWVRLIIVCSFVPTHARHTTEQYHNLPSPRPHLRTWGERK
eukprot:2454375-Amphidinium_carterae.1